MGDFISFDLQDFEFFINMLKTQNFQGRNEIYKFYQTITKISETSSGNPLINDNNFYLFSIDDISRYLSEKIPYRIHRCSNNCYHQNLNHCICNYNHKSVDGLHIDFNHNKPYLYFIECKKIDIMGKYEISGHQMQQLNNLHGDLGNHFSGSQLIINKKLLKYCKKSFESNFIGELRLKLLESLYSIIPNFYEQCLEENKVSNNDINGLKNFLEECHIEYIIVHDNYRINPWSRTRLIPRTPNCDRNLFDLQRYRLHPVNNVRLYNSGVRFLSFINNI